MYSGSNITARHSMSDLSNALFHLLHQYNEITITMICQEAQISRQTFYKLFKNKKGVVQYLISSNYSDFEEGFQKTESLTLEEFTKYTLEFFWKKKDLFDLLISHNLERYFLEEVQERLASVLELFQATPFLENKTIYNFLTGGLSSMILYQVGVDKEENIEQVAKEFADLMGNPVLR